jgi:hypothetical protein
MFLLLEREKGAPSQGRKENIVKIPYFTPN